MDDYMIMLHSSALKDERREILDLLELPLSFGKEGYKDTVDYVNKKAYIDTQLKGLKIHTIYSDRMYEWDSDKFNSASQEVWNDRGQYFSEKSQKPKNMSKFLSLYFDKKCTILAVITTENRATGYPVSCFFYSDGEEVGDDYDE